MKEKAMSMEDVNKTLESLAETETQVKITELTGKVDEGCLVQDKPKPEDPREKNLKRFIDICNRFGFRHGDIEMDKGSDYFHPTVILDDEFYLRGQCHSNSDTIMYGVNLCRKKFDGKVVSYSLDMYQDKEWIEFAQDWKLIKRLVLERVEKIDIIETLVKSLMDIKYKIDLQVKSQESKEQKYDWMIAIEKAKKLLEE